MKIENPRHVLEEYYFTYIIVTILLAIVFVIIKCQFNITTFDKFLYADNNDAHGVESIFTLNYSLEYLISHIVLYLIFGLLFGIYVIISMSIKTIVVEFCIMFVQSCDYNKLNIDTAISSISIGLVFYVIGALINYFVFDFDYKQKYY